jgi:hypothetical protein
MLLAWLPSRARLGNRETGLPALKLFSSCVVPLVRVSMSFPLGAWCPSGISGERERRMGTKVMAVFLYHIGSEVNT